MNESLLARVDHLVYATRNLNASIDDLERRLGIRASPGGRHPDRGTKNALIALGPRSYLEIVGPDLDSPPPTAPRWFGIDYLSEPRLATWAAAADNLAEIVSAAASKGIKLGPVACGVRVRADGVSLRWSFTDPIAVCGDGIVPFFIDWGESPHPAASAAAGAELIEFHAEHPNPNAIQEMLGVLGVFLHVKAGPKPVLAATIRAPLGMVSLR